MCLKKYEILFLERPSVGNVSKNLIAVLLSEEDLTSCEFKNYTRMNRSQFELLLKLVAPAIKKENSVMREAIPPQERLLLTLRYLATGNE